jgi:hypothetical protein
VTCHYLQISIKEVGRNHRKEEGGGKDMNVISIINQVNYFLLDVEEKK